MDFLIKSGQSLKGEITVPGDKSISHRSIILSSLAVGTSKISGLLEVLLALLREKHLLRACRIQLKEISHLFFLVVAEDKE